MELFTVGHSNHSIDEFLTLLIQHEITALADVRSHPYSRYLPHFNQSALKSALEQVGIRYVFLGQELGARPDNPSCYVNGKALYERIAETEAFSKGLERVKEGAKHYRIALMCAEQDPMTCHRAILVSPVFKNQGWQVQHILKDGSLESHHSLEERLLKLHHLMPSFSGGVQLSLFAMDQEEDLNSSLSEEERLQKAYHLQGDQIAYVEKTSHTNSV